MQEQDSRYVFPGKRQFNHVSKQKQKALHFHMQLIRCMHAPEDLPKLQHSFFDDFACDSNILSSKEYGSTSKSAQMKCWFLSTRFHSDISTYVHVNVGESRRKG